ncbi:MAG: flagellar biosynthesis anti-sigma factor FlgM [Caldibacillus debilis]|jgi:negative regulator of flagellin synthesis FlgM|uniref:Negative regulator of flagellin synthesis n=2 Tax=Caldibacillus debilis TaxID=301148 RepID=A0A420VHM3_9BACI|nr:flagellar biosynthesis anti-sigma factor FlgM [Caldibacillus debilis]MBO2482266.1 flagellar biosynthesis anti-sigma factor FlgM [Bacillaceae bacterium]KYD22156.1 hypothetical protein B4135_1501 [Caldibacillus debilis]MBY6271568.1 flagellar biosynthesis anti-sigma factor FlgM [Bacillaceae bacterium]OUM90153.1 MAG: flagellar biosynthesis anti-sigma factor FlgM [Caldibacillus debilis]REJ17166.1 MAG: flagellar biosynthesis anti-sigma factor FlgM [Caldibacillus debilis]
MKIDPFGPTGIHPYKQPYPRALSANHKKTKDRLEISSEAIKLQQHSSVIADRKKKVSEIRSQIESGTYKIDEKELAKAIFRYYFGDR